MIPGIVAGMRLPQDPLYSDVISVIKDYGVDDGVQMTDAKGINWVMSDGPKVLRHAEFPEGAIKFSGAGGVDAPTSPVWNIGTRSFTIETRVIYEGGGTNQTLCSMGALWQIYISTDRVINFWVNGSNNVFTAGTLEIGQVSKIAFFRNNTGLLCLSVNDQLRAAVQWPNDIAATTFCWGRFSGNSNHFRGYVGKWRITLSQSRYTQAAPGPIATTFPTRGPVLPPSNLSAVIMALTPWAYYGLNDTGTSAQDLSGNARHLQHGTGVLRDQPPLVNDGGKSAYFAGNGNSVTSAQGIGNFGGAKDLTVFAVLRSFETSPTASKAYLHFGNAGLANQQGPALFVKGNGSLTFESFAAGNWRGASSPTGLIIPGVTTVVAMNHNPITQAVTIWVNGVLVSTTPWTWGLGGGSSTLLSLATAVGGGVFFTGYLDHVAIFDKTLSTQEHQDLASAAGLYSPPA